MRLKIIVTLVTLFLIGAGIPLTSSNFSQANLDGGNQHDVGVTSIDSPVSGVFYDDVFTPEVTVENFGSSNEIDIPVNMRIDEIVDTWIEFAHGGTGHWEQFDYASGEEYAPGFVPEGDYFAQANAYVNHEDIFNVGLFMPPLDLSGLSNVTLEFNMCFTHYDADWGEVNTWSGGSFEENLAMYTTNITGHKTITFDPSGYVNPSKVYIEFYYTSAGQTNIYSWFSIDDIIINEIGFSEGFEGHIFPPPLIAESPQYNETVILSSINDHESKAVTFPDWTPYGSVDYMVTACTQMTTDENTSNDCKTEVIVLFFHPPSMLEISDVVLIASDPIDTIIGWEYISCNVTDDTAVGTVQLNVIYPDLHIEIIPMSLDSGDTYYCNTTLTAEGCYAYHVWANDTDDNQNTSSSQQFELPPNEDVDMNGQIHFMDLVAIVLRYAEYGHPGWVREDVDNNGQIHFMDLVAIVLRYAEYWDAC